MIPLKILYVSQYFPPEMGAPAARVFELSREWVRDGHQVTVLTAFPNHPTGIVPPEYQGQLIRRERVHGIDVVRVPIFAAANKGVVKRALSYASYSVSASMLGPLLTARPDVLIATSPQLLTAVAGLWLSRLRRVPFVFDVRDLWPRSIVEVGAMDENSVAIRLLEKIEQQLYESADRIVVVTESFVDEIAARGIDRSKISVITNGVDLELFSPMPRLESRQALSLPGGFLVSYVGTHGMAHGLDTVLDTAKLVADEGIRFLLVGEGAEKERLKARVRAESISNVTLWDQQPRSNVAKVISASDVCLVMLRNLPVFRTVIPSKIFEFMAAARPILTTVDGESRTIIERCGAGLFVSPENPVVLAAELRRLRANPESLVIMGNAGREHASAYYSRASLARRYLTLLDTVRSDFSRRN